MRKAIYATALMNKKFEVNMQAVLYRIATAVLMTASCVTAVLAEPDTGRTAASNEGGQRLIKDVHVVGPCRFHISPMFGGFFEDSEPGDSPPQGFYHLPDSGPGHSPVLYGGFPLYCVNAGDTAFIDTLLAAKKIDGQWRQLNEDGAWVPFDANQRFEAVDFSGPTWIGHGTLISDTTDDESKRSRWFRFCLAHTQVALCGKTRVQWIAQPSIDELPKVNAILNSIEFVDEAASAPAGASSY